MNRNQQHILFVDAYDSFAQNITALLHDVLFAKVHLIRIDTNIAFEYGCSIEAYTQNFDAIVLGPGPGDPRNGVRDTGIYDEILNVASLHKIPVIGICLGFQTLCLRYGLSVQRLPEPCHGHAKEILPTKKHPTFCEVEGNEIIATCYNSLGVLPPQPEHTTPDQSRPSSSSTNASFNTNASGEKSPRCPSGKCDLEVLALDRDGYVMMVSHKMLPFCGFQYHPESCKSNKRCQRLLKSWYTATVLSEEKLGAETSHQIHRQPQVNGKVIAPIPKECSSRSEGYLRNLLLNFTQHSGNTVNYAQKKFDGSRGCVARLAQKLNATNNLVMLESTKKGRFSIYPILGNHWARKSFQNSLDRNEDEGTCFVTFKGGTCKISLLHNLSSGVEIDRSDRSDSATQGGQVCSTIERRNFINALETFMLSRQARGGPDQIPFWGGFIGNMSYELGLDIIEAQAPGSSTRTMDDVSLIWVERSLVFDNQTSDIFIQTIRRNDHVFIQTILAHIDSEIPSTTENDHRTKDVLQKTLSQAKIIFPSRESYNNAYDRCQDHLCAGNSYELCLTTKALISLPHLPPDLTLALYENMHAHNPVPYGAYLDLPNVTILSSSPEQFMSWNRSGKIDMKPMKGTVKRTPSMTLARATGILSTPKESAENLMIADLIRHDLYSAVGYTSKVEVIKLCETVEHETVYQLISHIRAHAPIPSGASDETTQKRMAMHYGLKALTSSLPPGSMTGAPKKRSCEILHDLENRNRGVYSGVIGYLDVGGGGAWSVCIRTAYRSKDVATTQGHFENDTWEIGAGGAITVLSRQQGEWDEMQTKLGSVLKGFTVVQGHAEL